MFTTLADGDLPKVAHVQHSDRKVNNATLEQQAAEETKELSLSSSVYNVKPVSKGEIAFVFDIDGVFVRGTLDQIKRACKNPLPASVLDIFLDDLWTFSS